MKYILIIISILLISQINLVESSAAAAAGGAAAAANNARLDQEFLQDRRSDSCHPPEDFAIKNQCTLKYPDRYDRRVGSYTCQQGNGSYYNIISSCNGTITSERYIALNELNNDEILIIFVFAILSMFIIGIFHIYRSQR